MPVDETAGAMGSKVKASLLRKLYLIAPASIAAASAEIVVAPVRLISAQRPPL